MLHHRHKQIEPQRRPTRHHFRLHRTATLKSRAATDDQREIMRAQTGVAGRRVSVREACGCQDCAGI
jgi:hypothetical protein